MVFVLKGEKGGVGMFSWGEMGRYAGMLAFDVGE